ncbi:MAG: hypothetical protein ACPGRC_08050 [Salibacteraceae bacterium]
MYSIADIKQNTRQKNKPSNLSKMQWVSSINWTIEAWKCYLNGQKWIHDFVITCPEQYHMLLNDKGQLILPDLKAVRFEDNEANRAWAKLLRSQIIEMRDRGEWNESIEWTKVLRQLVKSQGTSPNENGIVKQKAVKGHKLIRIKPAA